MKCIYELGDKVFCIVNGWGFIERIREEGLYVIEVRFEDGKECYTKDGKVNKQSSHPTIYFEEIKFPKLKPPIRTS